MVLDYPFLTPQLASTYLTALGSAARKTTNTEARSVNLKPADKEVHSRSYSVPGANPRDVVRAVSGSGRNDCRPPAHTKRKVSK